MNLIKVAGTELVTFAILPTAETQREEALTAADCIGRITTAEQQDAAVVCLRSLKTLLKQVEDSRKAVKAPVLDLGKRIDTVATQFAAELEREASRISRFLSEYQAEQLRVQQEAERKRQTELERIRKEQEVLRRAEEEKAATAERERQAKLAEASRRSAAEAARVAEQQEKQRKAEEEARAQAALAAKLAEASVAAPVVAARANGMRVQKEWVAEVVDVAALYAARPELVALEPRAREINRAVAGGLRECPGLRIFERVKAGVLL